MLFSVGTHEIQITIIHDWTGLATGLLGLFGLLGTACLLGTSFWFSACFFWLGVARTLILGFACRLWLCVLSLASGQHAIGGCLHLGRVSFVQSIIIFEASQIHFVRQRSVQGKKDPYKVVKNSYNVRRCFFQILHQILEPFSYSFRD